MKVLLADDDRVLTRLLSVQLRDKGWQVDVAHDAIGPAQRLNRVRSKPGQSDSLTYL